jgi:hypothetical protein
VPSILYTTPGLAGTARAPGYAGSDTLYPSAFWMMNAYNDFTGNHAVGMGGFGACYWLLGAGLSGDSLTTLKWASGTASDRDYAGTSSPGGRQAPLKRFVGNTCATAAYAIMTELLSVPPGVDLPPHMTVFDARSVGTEVDPSMLPRVGGNFSPMRFADKGGTPTCAPTSAARDGLANNATYCVTSVIDRFTTSFNWADVNLGSVWLRPWNYVFVNGAITDQLFGGLGFVSGGSWDQVLPDYLTITKDSLFVGTTRARPAGQASYVEHEAGPDVRDANCLDGRFCQLPADGVALGVGGLNPQRLITIYDGPFFSDGSRFENVRSLDCPVAADDHPNPNQPASFPARRKICGIYATTTQPLAPGSAVDSADFTKALARVMNAAIGWKQPNGFYYPPAFAFRNTSFGAPGHAGDVRHNVLDSGHLYWQSGPTNDGASIAIRLLGSAATPAAQASVQDSKSNKPIDFMTILNDLDGSLNGVIRSDGNPRTSGLSKNPFYWVPTTAPQCSSFGTSTMPADFVSTVVAKLDAMPSGATPAGVDPKWAGTKLVNGTEVNQGPLIPIYRQLTLPRDTPCTGNDVCNGIEWACTRASLLMGTQTGQSPGLVVDGGTYYLDTNVAPGGPRGCFSDGEIFEYPTFRAQDTYVVYNLFGKRETRVTYQVYVGPAFDPAVHGKFVRAHPHWGLDLKMAVEADQTRGTATVQDGILSITLDHARLDPSDYGFPAAGAPGTCAPRDLCQPNAAGDGCGANSARYPAGSRLHDQVESICKSWVERKESEVAGVFLEDCPHGGCLGYAFTLQPTAGTAYAPVGYATLPLASGTPYDASWNAITLVPTAGSDCPLTEPPQ